MSIQAAVKVLESLSYQEMQTLIPTFNAMMKSKRAAVAVAKVEANDFKFGNVLGWFCNKRTHRRNVFIKYEGLNRAGDCVVGRECTPDGVVHGVKWTVGISNIETVNGKPIKK